MKVEEFDHGGREMEVLVGMALDVSACGRIASKWKKPLFASPSANLFGSLCVKYYSKHGKAPGLKVLRNLFTSWAENRRDEESLRGGERYWSFLQDEIRKMEGHVNSDHIIDVAGALFDEVDIRSRVERALADLDAGNLDKARESISGYDRVELGVGAVLNVHQDEAAVDAFCAVKPESLITYPGALKHFFSRTLRRGKLVAFCGPEKAGKSWWLLDMAWRASEQGRRVAYFECGDMTDDEVKARVYSRSTQRPVESSDREETWPCEVHIPLLLHPPAKPDKIAAEVDFKTCTFKRPPNAKRIKESLRGIVSSWDNQEPRLKFSFHPAGTLGVNKIGSILDDWAREGWMADVVVCDYADILADPPGIKDFRHTIAKNWEGLRSLSMARHVLVLTATQARRDAYDKILLKREHISEDKRKLAYASAIVGINVYATEKENDMCRLNWLANRGKRTSYTEVVHVAGCLALANPCVLSIYP